MVASLRIKGGARCAAEKALKISKLGALTKSIWMRVADSDFFGVRRCDRTHFGVRAACGVRPQHVVGRSLDLQVIARGDHQRFFFT